MLLQTQGNDVFLVILVQWVVIKDNVIQYNVILNPNTYTYTWTVPKSHFEIMETEHVENIFIQKYFWAKKISSKFSVMLQLEQNSL